MTEAEWLACEEPKKLCASLAQRLSDRRTRLFVSACARAAWGKICFLDADQEASWTMAVCASEQFADGLVGPNALEETRAAVIAAFTNATDLSQRQDVEDIKSAFAVLDIALETAAPRASDAAEWALRFLEPCQWTVPILRDIVGNPFLPFIREPAWFTSTVAKFAQSIYDERKFTDMPILANAVEEAGCIDTAILEHCRSGGEHVRGCWVLDRLLGNE